MKLYTTTEAATYLKVEPVTIRKYLAKRTVFPNAEKRGRDWLIPESDLEQFKRPRMGRPPQERDDR